MNDDADGRSRIHGTTTCVVESDGHLDDAFGFVASGRPVLITLSTRLNRPTLDELTESIIARARAANATVIDVGRPDWRREMSRRVWKPLANALGNRSFFVMPSSLMESDVQVRRRPTQVGDERVAVGRTISLRSAEGPPPSP